MIKEKEVRYRVICMDKVDGVLKLVSNKMVDYVTEKQDTDSNEVIFQDLFCEQLVKSYGNDVVIVIQSDGAILYPKKHPYAAYIFGEFYNFTKLPFNIIQMLKDEAKDDEARKAYNSICELCKMNMKTWLDSLKRDLKVHKEQLKTLEETVENAQTEYDILFGE